MAAAGNSAADPCTWYYDPVTTSDKLIVGSTTDGDDASYFSNYGACVHVQVLTPPHPAPRSHLCMSARQRPAVRARPPARPPPDRAPAAHVRRPLAPESWVLG